MYVVIGCMLYELCALCPPFEAPDQARLDDKIKRGRFTPVPQHFSQDMSDAIK
jgi:serine/threonine protein kinase